MAGTRLEAEVFIVTGSATAAQNVRKSVSRAGYEVAELVLEPIASSLSVLSEDEREIGVAVVELGGGTTDLAVFHERKIRHLATLPWGGAAVTNDIAKGLSLPYAEATRIKERWGAARTDNVDPHDTFEVPGPVPGQGVTSHGSCSPTSSSSGWMRSLDWWGISWIVADSRIG